MNLYLILKGVYTHTHTPRKALLISYERDEIEKNEAKLFQLMKKL